MFRVLSRLFVALFALLAMRLFFVFARGVSRGMSSDAERTKGNAPPSGAAKGAGRSGGPGRPPRIDRSTAEDVPYVEIEGEHAARR